MTTKRLYAIRGAVCTSNTVDSIDEAVFQLYSTIKKENTFSDDDMVSIQFTLTNDLTEENPAAALRKKCGVSSVPLFCSVEPPIKNSLQFVIRILITVYMDKKPVPVYLNGAEKLRPDLAAKK